MKTSDNDGLHQNKSAFLLFLQLCLFSIILFNFCRVVFPQDFVAFDSLTGGYDAGIVLILSCLFFIGYTFRIGAVSYVALYVRMPAIIFWLSSFVALALGSMGGWFFGVLLLSACLVWFVQTLLTGWQPWLTLPVFAANTIVTLFLYIDQLHYSLTQEHLNFYYLRILRTFGTDIFDSLGKAGVTPAMYLLPAALLLLPMLLYYPVQRCGVVLKRPATRLHTVVLFLLFLPLYFQFHIFAHEIPISEYMNFKIRNFWFPLPDPPSFSAAGVNTQIVPDAAVRLTAEDFIRQPGFAWQGAADQKNVVILVLESLRHDYLMQYMPKTAALAREGIQCLNHYANANDTEGALLALYYGILPLARQRSNFETKPSAWIEFMKAAGYEFTRISGSSGSLFFPEYNYIHFRDYFRKNGLPVPETTTYDENSRYQCDAVIHKLKNSSGKCLIEAYLFHMHYKFWYPERLEKYLPVLEDNSEVVKLDFAESAMRLANRYRNSCLYTDELVSDLVERLKAEGLFDDTIVVVMGDHGEMLGENGRLFHANGGEKIQFHAPIIILGKDVPAVQVDKVTSHVDIVPTLGRLLGFSAVGAYGDDVLTDVEKGAVTFDLAGPDRVIYRDRQAASLFQWSGKLAWIVTSAADFQLDDKLELLYAPENIAQTLSIAEGHAKKLLETLTEE